MDFALVFMVSDEKPTFVLVKNLCLPWVSLLLLPVLVLSLAFSNLNMMSRCGALWVQPTWRPWTFWMHKLIFPIKFRKFLWIIQISFLPSPLSSPLLGLLLCTCLYAWWCVPQSSRFWDFFFIIFFYLIFRIYTLSWLNLSSTGSNGYCCNWLSYLIEKEERAKA